LSGAAQTLAHRLVRVGPSLDIAAARELRRCMELRHFKWDAQVGDVTTLAPFPLLMSAAAWRELATLAEQLGAETLALERALAERPRLHARIAVPRPLRRLLSCGVATPAAARIMRFDFHPTPDGWRVSEVNSDVPGGFSEATSFTALAAAHVAGARPAGDPTAALVAAIARHVAPDGSVALTSAPGHMEDHQVVAHLATALRRRGLSAYTVSLNQLSWHDGRARLDGQRIDVIYRFYQGEWLAQLSDRLNWKWLFVAGRTAIINPVGAVLSESKRLPLIWDDVPLELATWRRLLPETRALADAPWSSDEGWLIKAAYSNTGDTVLIRSAMSAPQWLRQSWAARLRPGEWVAQRRFDVVPIHDAHGPLFPCIGVYVVDGKAAGAYARVARGPVINFSAQDVALLIYDGP
jgi:glutathionylspermidine synthase